MLTLTEVQANISDPSLFASISSNNDEAAAARLSEILTEIAPIPLSVLSAWAVPSIRSKLEDHAGDQNSPLRSISLTALDLMRGSFAQNFDTITYSAMLDALQAGGVVSQTERDELLNLSKKFRNISANDVARAVRNDDGSSKL